MPRVSCRAHRSPRRAAGFNFPSLIWAEHLSTPAPPGCRAAPVTPVLVGRGMPRPPGASPPCPFAPHCFLGRETGFGTRWVGAHEQEHLAGTLRPTNPQTSPQDPQPCPKIPGGVLPAQPTLLYLQTWKSSSRSSRISFRFVLFFFFFLRTACTDLAIKNKAPGSSGCCFLFSFCSRDKCQRKWKKAFSPFPHCLPSLKDWSALPACWGERWKNQIGEKEHNTKQNLLEWNFLRDIFTGVTGPAASFGGNIGDIGHILQGHIHPRRAAGMHRAHAPIVQNHGIFPKLLHPAQAGGSGHGKPG